MQDRHQRIVDTGQSEATRPARPTRRDGPDTARPKKRPEVATLPAADAADAGRREIASLTGREPEGVVSLQAEGDGWLVGVEVLEHHRVPSSADLLALYEAKIDRRGRLAGYRRTGRYTRSASDAGGPA